MTFLFVFFTIWGFKISVLDLSILVPLIILIIKGHYQIPPKALFLSIIGLSIIAYQIIIQVVYTNFDFVAVGRLIRALLNLVFIGMFLHNMANNKMKDVYHCLILVLLCNSILVIVSAFVVDISYYLSFLTGNDRYKLLRSSGLASGFDFAGFGALAGLILVYFNPFKSISFYKQLAFYLLFIVSTLFMSRVSMALGIAIGGWAIASLPFNREVPKALKLIIIITVAPLAYLVIDYFILIVKVTYGLAEVSNTIVERYASQSKGALGWEYMFFLPSTLNEIVWGTGQETLESDVGYIKDIFRFGIVGVLVVLIFHILPFIVSEPNKPLKRISICILGLLILLSFKNNYFLARTSFPIFIFTIMLFLNYKVRNETTLLNSIRE
ncbi:hypothetical protein [Thalassotalea aquiviva]|uniref:hypothetical protein n=1 Tax=Thalassotalea aquiviva TaxID=3242415 RepID=UPI00352A0C41